MNKFKVGLDFDDVIAPFIKYCVGLCNMERGTNYTIDQIDRWGTTGSKAIEDVSSYYGEERILRMQQVPEEAINFVHKLMEIADVYFVSAVKPEFMGIRAMQIKTAFPELGDDRIIMGCAKDLVKGLDMLLDDGPHNILDSEVSYPVLMRRPWNKHLSGVLSVNNYDEFLTLVDQIKAVTMETKHDFTEPQVIALVGPSGSRKHAFAKLLTTVGYGEILDTANNPYSKNFITRCFYAGHEYRLPRYLVENHLKAGYSAIVAVDICGALALKKDYPTTIVFCRQSREAMIRETLMKEDSVDNITTRLLSMDQELRNERLADISIRTDDLNKALFEIKEHF